MTETRPTVSPRGRYNIKKACDALGVCYNTFRKYADLGYIRVEVGRVGKYVWGEEIIRFWEAQG